MSEEKKENKTAGRVGRDTAGEVVTAEAVGEYVLPDYQPEIRKILSVTSLVLPSERYVGGERAEFSGRVMHGVLYTAEDGEMHALTLPADYSFSVPLVCPAPVCVYADSMAEGTVCRLGGPRKLTLRTRLRNMVHVFAEEEVCPEIRGMASAEDAASLECLVHEIESSSVTHAESGEFRLSDTVRLENADEGTRVVRTGGNLLVSECRVREDGCLLRGEAWVRALLAGEGTPYTVRAKIPFEQFVPLSCATAGGQPTAYGRVSLVEATVTEGEDGIPASLSFDVAAELELSLAVPVLARPTTELYSTAYEMTCRHRTLTASRALGSAMGNYTVSGSRARGECDAEEAVAAVDADGRIDITSVTVEHGRATVTGTVGVQMIFSTPAPTDGRPMPGTAEIPVPFRIETELRIPDGAHPRFDCHGELISVRGRIEQSTLAADCEIALALRATVSEELTVLAEAEPDRATSVPPCGGRILVCYPSDTDTLWSVAARYRCHRAALAAENGLSEDALAISHLPASLDGVHHLIISK